jgi:hypothetical protein
MPTISSFTLHRDIENCIMNHDVSTFKATSHATMSLKKKQTNRSLLLKCGSQMILFY